MNGKELILKIGNEILLPQKKEFHLNDPVLAENYRQIYQYFLGDSKGVLDINKSILICGNIGVGKTVMLKVMQRIFRCFYLIEAKKLKQLVIDNGAMQTMKDFGYDFKKALFIDDLGLEDPQMKMWGNELNIFSELFLERYRLFCDEGIKTHIITNHTTDELGELYGARVLDRILGAAEGNIIAWQGKTLRHKYDD